MGNNYYLLKSGRYINTSDIRSAFEIIEGYRPENNDERFKAFIAKLIVSTIREIVDPDDDSVKTIALSGQKVKAIQLFREIHNCSLMKASEYVTGIINSAY